MKGRKIISSHVLRQESGEKFMRKLEQILSGAVLYKAMDGRIIDFNSGMVLRGPRNYSHHTME